MHPFCFQASAAEVLVCIDGRLSGCGAAHIIILGNGGGGDSVAQNYPLYCYRGNSFCRDNKRVPYFIVFGVVYKFCRHSYATLAVCINDALVKGFELGVQDWESYIIYFVVTVGIYACICILFARNVKMADTVLPTNRNLLFIGMGVVFSVLILSHLFSGVKDELSMLIFQVCSAYDFIGCIFALALLYAAFRNNKLESEVAVMQHVIEQERRQMEASRENMELINIKCHDIKHQLGLLRGRVEDEEVENLENLVEIYDSSYNTGNEILDVILAEKSLYCKKHSITLTCMADGRELSFLSSVAIYSIFANAIENAIEAVSRSLNPVKGLLTLSCVKNGGCWSYISQTITKANLICMTVLSKRAKPTRIFTGSASGALFIPLKNMGATIK